MIDPGNGDGMGSYTVEETGLPKIPSGIDGFEVVSEGGVPESRVTLVAGTAGSGKTILACQFLAGGIRDEGEAGVFVTFEDPADAVRQNVRAFGWDIPEWEEAGQWVFVDASPTAGEPPVVVGEFDLGGLLARLERAVRTTGAKRISFDSLNALFSLYDDHQSLRREIFRITSVLKDLGVTSILTAERKEEYGDMTRHGIEEFVADNVIILRNAAAEEKRRRTMEILKFRGSSHQTGEFPFTIASGRGIIVIPLSAISLTQASSTVRITSGNETLDDMCRGGFFRDSVVLVSGATGTGKTLTTTQFLAGGAAEGQRSLLFAFEESREQLVRNAAAWGFDFPEWEKEGLIRIVPQYPHSLTLEDHLVVMKDTIEEYEPTRVAVDSLSALERAASVRSFREFVINLTATIKHREISGLFTANTPTLTGGSSITEQHISTLTDSIIMLRYVESFGRMRRGIAVLKMRGSEHDPSIREYEIDGTGMHIGEPMRSVNGVLWGNPTHVDPDLAAKFEPTRSPESG
jgi:circadian clock protein KaiC